VFLVPIPPFLSLQEEPEREPKALKDDPNEGETSRNSSSPPPVAEDPKQKKKEYEDTVVEIVSDRELAKTQGGSATRAAAASMRSETSLSIATDFERPKHSQADPEKGSEGDPQDEEEGEDEEVEEGEPSFFSKAKDEIVYFFHAMVTPRTTLGGDYYVPMFMSDLTVFLLTILFFTNFSSEPNSDLESVSALALLCLFIRSSDLSLYPSPAPPFPICALDFDGEYGPSALYCHCHHGILHHHHRQADLQLQVYQKQAGTSVQYCYWLSSVDFLPAGGCKRVSPLFRLNFLLSG